MLAEGDQGEGYLMQSHDISNIDPFDDEKNDDDQAKSPRINEEEKKDSDSDGEIIDTSEFSSVLEDDSQVAEEAAEAYAEMHYSNKRTEEEINYDHYQFSVA